ncbi:hypothetical protein P4V41_07400 [Fictibacillus nanhaiensis]|uniref:hypothetical protein n=1 Tax=Fictibacillus nanhaiensis TaxID=742169 RepID=UPI002E234B3A|nr:hypothetical protein [Fictibacillus nanhaiensis]
MNILNIEELHESGDYIHLTFNIYLEGMRFREVYTKFCRTTETSRSYFVLHGNVCQDISLTTSECDQINSYILSELLQTV